MESVIIEIRAGTGGREATLFAHDLFRMYKRYGERVGWTFTILEVEESDLKGFNSIAAEVTGKGAQALAHESGVHRVQRVPATEKSGRIHTSTASVAVLPKPTKSEPTLRPQELRFDVFRASGPGGQYVNKRESAVRVTHLPTGITVVSQTGRTQIQNREYALALLQARVSDAEAHTAKAAQRELRRAQIGSAERAEKIRTYNFLQDRLTDHRVKKSWHGIDRIMDGNLEPIMKAFERPRADVETGLLA